MSALTRTSPAQSLIVIYEISKILTASRPLTETLRNTLSLLASYLNIRHGLIALKDESGNLRVVASTGPQPRASSRAGDGLPDRLVRSIFESSMPFVARDVADDPVVTDLLKDETWPFEHRASFIGVPIKTMGQPFGVLAIERLWSETDNIVVDAEVRLLVMVSNLLAQTVGLHRGLASQSAAPCGPVPAPSESKRTRPERKREPVPVPPLEGFIGSSPAIRDVFMQINQVAGTRTTAMLRGESGTGKELIARAIHTLSPRKDRPFVKVNCAALPENLLESELFGHEKGAFTGANAERKGRFELADSGTLFLDEIGDISRTFQAKLLRVLQEGEFERVGGSRTLKVDIRLIAATNRNLEEAVAKGEFRGDLYYRINVIPIFVPSLRERRDDIPLLADFFLRQFNEENGRCLRFSEGALETIRGCNFPGNVRELENFVNRVATMARSDIISEVDLPCDYAVCMVDALGHDCARSGGPTVFSATTSGSQDGRAGRLGPAPSSPASGAGVTGPGVTIPDPSRGDEGEGPSTIDRQRLIRAMERSGWVQAKAARLLGLTPRQVGYALRKYGVEIKRI